MKRSDCIFCGEEAGSREHTFPAALGGRRTNKGILCGPCNNGFSGLDAQLEQQLAVVNGLLGVRSDRAKAPKLASFTDDRGNPVGLDSAGKPFLVSPRRAWSMAKRTGANEPSPLPSAAKRKHRSGSQTRPRQVAR